MTLMPWGPELSGRRLGHANYGEVGCVIGKCVRTAALSGDGRDVDDLAAVALRYHPSGGSLGTEVRAAHFDANDAVEHRGFEVDAWRPVRSDAKRGVVHQDVEPAEFADGLLDHPLDLGFVCYVDDEG